jgi:DNA-binding transcriptional LysR family regulator
MLKLQRLDVLRAVVSTGSVTAAAAELAYTPSAVSQHIAALERETGVKLLERAGRGVRATAAGTLLAAQAQEILARVGEAESALRALVEGRTGRLRLASFPSAGTALVPPSLAAFRARHPGVEVDLTLAEASPALAALREDRADLAIVLLDAVEADAKPPRLPAGGTLVWRPLLRDPFYVALRPDHPLAAQSSIALEQLAGQPLICADRPAGCPIAACFERCCERHAFTPRYAVEVGDYPTVQSLVAAGVGIAAIPQLGLAPAIHQGVVIRPLAEPPLVRRIYAVTRAGTQDGVLVAGMLEDLRASAALASRGA